MRGMTHGTLIVEATGLQKCGPFRRKSPKPPQEAQKMRETKKTMALTTMRTTPIVWSVKGAVWPVVVNLSTAPMANMMMLVDTPTGRSLIEAAGESPRDAGEVPGARGPKQIRVAPAVRGGRA